MSIENNIIEIGKRAKNASLNMKVCSSDQKNLALTKLTKNLDKNRNKILEANKIDLENGEKKSLAKPLINRLTLTEKSIDGLITSIEDIIEIPDPIGITLEKWERPNGLHFRKISTPLGVLLGRFSCWNCCLTSKILTLFLGSLGFNARAICQV